MSTDSTKLDSRDEKELGENWKTLLKIAFAIHAILFPFVIIIIINIIFGVA